MHVPPPLWETGKGPHCLEVRIAALPWDVRLLTHTILSYLGPRKPQELQEKFEFTSKTSLRRVHPSPLTMSEPRPVTLAFPLCSLGFLEPCRAELEGPL